MKKAINPFGTPLKDQVVPGSSSLPPFVVACITFLRSSGMGTEGLFRVSGNANRITKIKAKFEKGEKSKFSAKEDPHVVACLLKLFFRELPDPLLTYDLYDCWIAAQQFPEEHRVGAFTKLLAMLPPVNYAVLRYLCSFIRELLTNQKVTMMTPENLAIVFCPNLLRAREETIELVLADSPYAKGLFITLFTVEEIFEPKQSTLSSNQNEKDFLCNMKTNYASYRETSSTTFSKERDRAHKRGQGANHQEILAKKYARIQSAIMDEEIEKDTWNGVNYKEMYKQASIRVQKNAPQVINEEENEPGLLHPLRKNTEFQNLNDKVNVQFDNNQNVVKAWHRWVHNIEHQNWIRFLKDEDVPSTNSLADITSSEFLQTIKTFGPFDKYEARVREVVAEKFFYGFLSNWAARRFLQEEEVGTFLVRCSLSKPFSFVLEFVSDNTSTTAVLIRSSTNGFIPVTSENPIEFLDIKSLLKSYKSHLSQPFSSAIPKMPWFHPDVDGDEAYDILKTKPKGTFILRFSSQPGTFAVSYKSSPSQIDKITIKRMKLVAGGFHYQIVGVSSTISNGNLNQAQLGNRIYSSIEELLIANNNLFLSYIPNPNIII